MSLYLEIWIIALFVINLLILFIVKDIRSTQLKEKKKLRKVKREDRIRGLMLELYKLNAIEKIEVDYLDLLQEKDKEKGIKYRWFIDFEGEFINK
ncbi:MAG TPA: hypothetical protein VK982_14775 [Bacteroidales bacterium]|nr:hypothetical protein [Bacteroidales bacterium]